MFIDISFFTYRGNGYMEIRGKGLHFGWGPLTGK